LSLASSALPSSSSEKPHSPSASERASFAEKDSQLSVAGDEGLKPALDAFVDFVRSETLAVSVAWVDGQAIPGSGGAFASVEAGDKTWRAAVAKA
jgi:hypothetical protein